MGKLTRDGGKSAPRTHARDTRTGRTIRKQIGARFAADAVGPLSPGCEIFGLTMGRFSLIDLIVWILQHTGPARVDMATWTAGGADIDFAFKLLTDGRITGLRFLTDYSFPLRSGGYCAALRQKFGDNCIRLTKNHAKFVTVRNDTWNVVLRTSMNMNENPKVEWWEISDDAAMADFLTGFVDALFTNQQDTFGMKPGEFCERFGEEWSAGDAETRVADPRYFGRGPVDVDLNRVGFTYRS